MATESSCMKCIIRCQVHFEMYSAYLLFSIWKEEGVFFSIWYRGINHSTKRSYNYNSVHSVVVAKYQCPTMIACAVEFGIFMETRQSVRVSQKSYSFHFCWLPSSFTYHVSNMTDRWSDPIREKQHGFYWLGIFEIDFNWFWNWHKFTIVTIGQNCHNWSKLQQLVKIATIGQNLYNWSKLSQLVKIVTIGQNSHNWSKL